MKTIKIYGASDDLIEIEGDISEEFDHYNDEEPFYLAFSDGTALSVLYDKDGFWRINRLAFGSAEYSKHEGMDEDGDYSDIITLTGDIKWAIGGKNFAK